MMRFCFATISLLLALVSGCANPMPPTGGPVDQTAPSIVSSDPAINAVNVRPDRVTITFSEYINEGTFARALSITPEPDRPPEIRWHGRRVELRFREPLRENTTYTLTLDNNLRDLNGVALSQPVTVAFSTGPVINKGRLSGRVIDPLTGVGVGGVDVFAYTVQDTTGLASLPDRPDYRTQTDREGRFTLTYIGEQQYFVFAVTDRNRNRRPDAVESFAAPPRPALLADTTDTVAGRWPMSVLDTIPPTVQRVRPLSSRRVELRFPEGVRLDTTHWALADSATGRALSPARVYMRSDMPRYIFAETDSLPPGRYLFSAGAVRDSADNRMAPHRLGFQLARPLPDTTAFRIVAFGPMSPPGPIPLLPGEVATVSFTRPLTPAQFGAAIQVTDSAGTAISLADSVQQGTTIRVLPVTPPSSFIVRVDERVVGGRDSTFTQAYTVLPSRELGELGGVVASAEPAPVVIEVYPTGTGAARVPLRSVSLEQPGSFSIPGLPAGTYRLRAFSDPNRNGRWDGGMLVPYRRPERLAWTADSIRVRPRWENVISDTLRL